MNRHLTRFFLAFALVLGLCTALPLAPAASTAVPSANVSAGENDKKKIQLNDETMLFYVGGTYGLKLENAAAKKVTWKSSNKAVATVNTSGKVTARKTGKCTITARYNGKQYKCRATVVSDSKFLKSWCKLVAKDIKRKYKSPYDQVIAATCLVARGFSYGSARNAMDVLKKGQGTCVSANKLLVEILGALGFKANLRFAAKDDMTKYPPGVMFMSEHHNVKVKIKGKTYYVDGTPEVGMYYMSSSKKPIYCEMYILDDPVVIDQVPGHKEHFNRLQW